MPISSLSTIASRTFCLAVVFAVLYVLMARDVQPHVAEAVEERPERLVTLVQPGSLDWMADAVAGQPESALTKTGDEAAKILTQAGQEPVQPPQAREAAETAEEHEAGQPSSGMPQFDPSTFTSQIFWLIVTFITLYFLMARIVLPRIGEVLEERSERLAADLDKAQALKKEADAVVAQYEAALARARDEATRVLTEAGQEISEESNRRQQEFSAELARKTADAEARIDAAKEAAKTQVRDIAQAAAGDIVEKLTGSSPADQTVTRNVDAVMKETV